MRAGQTQRTNPTDAKSDPAPRTEAAYPLRLIIHIMSGRALPHKGGYGAIYEANGVSAPKVILVYFWRTEIGRCH